MNEMISKELLFFSIFGLILLIFFIKEISKMRDEYSLNRGWKAKLPVLTLVFLLVGFFIRIFYLDYPYVLPPDEAISGYETWCLANYGVDQHLYSYPVYFKSWGSGQSALYSYIAIPFVKLFGLSKSVYRLPMALISCFSLLVFYLALKKSKQNVFFICIATLFFAFNPWHIMMSRWVLDCNLSPNMLLLGVSFFIIGYYSSKKMLYYLAASIAFVLAAYSYGINWFMLPILFLLLVRYFYKNRKLSLGRIAFLIVFTLLLLLPIMLFAILLFFGGETYQISGFTIPQLDEGRHVYTTVFGHPQPFLLYLTYIKKAVFLLIAGTDNLRMNSIVFFGQFYNLLGLPFIIFYFVDLYKRRNITPIDTIFLFWLVSVLPILLFVEPNVNHWNALWFPLIYFCSRGIYLFFSKSLLRMKISISAICILAVAFIVSYSVVYQGETYHNDKEQKYVITKAYSLNVDTIYADYYNFYYPTTLFYHPVSPYVFKNKIHTSGNIYDNVDRYDNLIFSLPDHFEPLPHTAYLIYNKQRDMYMIDESKFQKWEGNVFTIYWNE